MNPTLGHIQIKFEQIDGRDYRGIIRFYEENYQQIFLLKEFLQYYYKYQYVIALFNIGRYQRVLHEIDPLIEWVFYQNVNFDDENSFEFLIFKKAAANLNCHNHEKAVQLARELIGMNPKNTDYTELMLQALREKENKDFKFVQFVAIMFILASAVLSAFIWSLRDVWDARNLRMLFFISLSMNAFAVLILANKYLWREIKSRRGLKKILNGH